MSKPKSPNTVDWSLLKRLLPFAKPYKWGFAVGLLCMLAGTGLELVGPLLTRKAIDESIPNRDFTQLKWLVIGYFILTSLGYLLRYAEGQVSGWYGQRIVWDIRKKVFTHFQNHSLAFFDRNPVGKLMTRVTSDVAAMSELFHAGLVGLAGDTLMLIGILVVLFVVDWRLALVTLTIGPLLIVSSLVFRSRVRESMRRMRIEITNTNTYLQESVTGSKVIKLFRRERLNAGQFSLISSDLKKAQLQTIFFFALFFPIVDILATTAIAATLLTGGWQILDGAITVGSLVAFLQYSERFFRPIRDLTDKFNTLLSAITGAERVFGVLDEPLDIVTPNDPHPVKRLSGAIDFDRVSFEYVTGVPVLQDISFTVKPGEAIALVGATGAGKSTVLSLLGRHYEATHGAIRVDGVDVGAYDLQQLRSQIAVVLQDVYLFAGTVAENISLQNPSISREKIEWAAREVGANEFIENLPQGYDTQLMERGVNLSVGQKQLISLARALATDPAILLLDEATSAVDSETERRIQLGLSRIMQDRTSIVVAHRLSTIQHADRIFVFHKGHLREQGNHAELLSLDGIYAKLHRLQFSPV